MIFGCAAWSAPLLLVSYFAVSRYPVTAVATFYGLSLFFNYPHYMATIYRAYRSREDRLKYRLFTLHITAAVVITAVLAHWLPAVLPLLFTLYITWSPWHYTGQNFGLAMMFARRAGANPTDSERQALHISFIASYAMLFLALHTGPSQDQYLRSLDLPAAFSRPAGLALFAVFACACGWSCFKMAGRAGTRQMAAPIILCATQGLWFALPAVLQLGFGMSLPPLSYSTGIMAVMHAAQYLWITSFYARRECQADAPSERIWRPLSYYSVLVIGGIALFVPGPLLISRVLRYDYFSSFLVFTSLINIHHFILDGAIWKLRDSRIASLLVGAREATAASSPAAQSLGRAVEWVSGRTGLARGARLGVAVLLVLAAGFDQIRFVSGLGAGAFSDVARAESLDPYDSALLVRVGKSESDGGHPERAIETYRRAVRINPYDAVGRTNLARLLIQQQRYDEAYQLYEQIKPHISRDANALINFGILADAMGRKAEAVQSWEQAISVDPTQRNAHLYVADAYDDEAQYARAVVHYEAYLTLAAGAPGQKLDLRDIVSVSLKAAHDYSVLGEGDRALAYCNSAYGLATKGPKSLQNLVLIQRAELFAALGRKPEALEGFRQALVSDRDQGDRAAEAVDWLSYGRFLKDSGGPPSSALACIIKAQSLVSSGDTTDLDALIKMRHELEAQLGDKGAAAVVSHAEDLADESLTLSPPASGPEPK